MNAKIVYYSREGKTYLGGQLVTLETGISAQAAKLLQEETRADLFRLERAAPEPADFSDYMDLVLREYQREARPELKAYPDLTGTDTLYLVYPNYFKTMPMPVYRFLEQSRLQDMQIFAVVTHGGDGFGDSLEKIRDYTKGCRITEGPCIRDTEIRQADVSIRKWIREKGTMV